MKITSQLKLAEALGCHRDTVRNYIKRGTIKPKGPWNLSEVREAVEGWNAAKKEKVESRYGSEELRTRLTVEQTKRICGRIEGTRLKLNRARRRLDKLRAQHPRRVMLCQRRDSCQCDVCPWSTGGAGYSIRTAKRASTSAGVPVADSIASTRAFNSSQAFIAS